MQTNIITYLCFFILCGLVVCDMWLSTNILLQIVCIVLALLVVGLTAYIAHKWHKGSYLSNEQAKSYQVYLSENIALRNELASLQHAPAKSKAINIELQNLVVFNRRLTVQNSNLKTHLVQLSELLQTAKNQAKTVVLPITPNEQNQTASNNKKAKTA